MTWSSSPQYAEALFWNDPHVLSVFPLPFNWRRGTRQSMRLICVSVLIHECSSLSSLLRAWLIRAFTQPRRGSGLIDSNPSWRRNISATLKGYFGPRGKSRQKYLQFLIVSQLHMPPPNLLLPIWTWNLVRLLVSPQLSLSSAHPGKHQQTGFDPSWLLERKYSSWLYKTDIGSL